MGFKLFLFATYIFIHQEMYVENITFLKRPVLCLTKAATVEVLECIFYEYRLIELLLFAYSTFRIHT